jgi:N-terminal EH-domain containing protein
MSNYRKARDRNYICRTLPQHNINARPKSERMKALHLLVVASVSTKSCQGGGWFDSINTNNNNGRRFSNSSRRRKIPSAAQQQEERQHVESMSVLVGSCCRGGSGYDFRYDDEDDDGAARASPPFPHLPPHPPYIDPQLSQQQQQSQPPDGNSNNNPYRPPPPPPLPDLPYPPDYQNRPPLAAATTELPQTQQAAAADAKEEEILPWDTMGSASDAVDDLSAFDKEYILKGLARLYRKKILPLELSSRYGHFHSPPLSPSDFDAPPMILLLGQYSVGKTSFVKYLLGRDFPVRVLFLNLIYVFLVCLRVCVFVCLFNSLSSVSRKRKKRAVFVLSTIVTIKIYCRTDPFITVPTMICVSFYI